MSTIERVRWSPCADCGKLPPAGKRLCKRCARTYRAERRRLGIERPRTPTTREFASDGVIVPSELPEATEVDARNNAIRFANWIVTEPSVPLHLRVQMASRLVALPPSDEGESADVVAFLERARGRAPAP